MQFDLGLTGLGILVGLSLVFGVIAHLILAKATTRWLWLIGAIGYFIGGLFASEVLFGTATIDEIQPIIDGLALDEAGLVGLGIGVAVVLVTWYVTRQSGVHRPMAP